MNMDHSLGKSLKYYKIYIQNLSSEKIQAKAILTFNPQLVIP